MALAAHDFMNKTFGALLLSVACSAAQAEPSKWVKVASSKDVEKYVQLGSYERRQNKSIAEIAVVTGKTLDKKTQQIEFEKWYVRTEDCRQKQGKLVSLTLSGEYRFDNDFISGGGTVASAVAETICIVYQMEVAEKEGKGI